MNQMLFPIGRRTLVQCIELPTPAGPVVVVLPTPIAPPAGSLIAATEDPPSSVVVQSEPAGPDLSLRAAMILIEHAIAADPGVVRTGHPAIWAIRQMLNA